MEINNDTLLEMLKSFNTLADSIKTGLIYNASHTAKKEISLIQFSREYSELLKHRFSEDYLRSIELSFRHITDCLGNKSITDISAKDIEKLILFMQKSAPEGYRVYFRNLKTAFNKAVDWGYLTDNPFNKVRLKKKQVLKPDYITKEDLNKVLNHIKNPVISNIITTGFYTGMRLNEILNLTWHNVNLNERIIQIGDSTFQTKTRRAREIPVCNEVYNILVSIYPRIFVCSKPYVFGKDIKTPFTDNYISKKFKEASRKAGLNEKIHFHSLRHSAASYLVNKNVSINVIRELLGHTSINTTMIYTHVDFTSMREAVSLFDIDEVLESSQKEAL